MATLDWQKYSYVIASKYRKRIITSLLDSPKTPKQLSDQTKIYMSHISRTLRDLKERNIVECLIPYGRKGKLFSLTSEGRAIAEQIMKVDSEIGGIIRAE
ncbi:MAG: winged helix-turn-helix domain-containing protein [Candidatus Bathyarchaeia archaeon]|uniref:ArsR family transcriptional regulator n=1 Tax=Candidatus Hadarchaeum sp. TaxID=2883567 RepID=UPI0031732A11